MTDTSSHVAYIAARARALVALAEELGVSLRIDRQPLQPLGMGHARHVVEAWPARHSPRLRPKPASNPPAAASNGAAPDAAG